jgi:hypothetical protein
MLLDSFAELAAAFETERPKPAPIAWQPFAAVGVALLEGVIVGVLAARLRRNTKAGRSSTGLRARFGGGGDRKRDV